ncbi:spheroidene monooxygenase [Palleronia sediminis]|nr:spheroidene monooxygenase [Palleronia sediminis]
MQTVTLTLHRFDRVAVRPWVVAQMGLSRLDMARLPGCTFWKLCGTGSGAGFSPRPNWSTWAILACWEDRAAAEAGLAAQPYRRWAARADAVRTIVLEPAQARGQWSGRTPFAPDGNRPIEGPVAALTRATIRPRHLARFWARVPDIHEAILSDMNVTFRIGLGEVPWLHQVTFSIWPDARTMADFARADGPHMRAVRAVRAGDWFSEELYARFAVIEMRGAWPDETSDLPRAA